MLHKFGKCVFYNNRKREQVRGKSRRMTALYQSTTFSGMAGNHRKIIV